MFLQSLFSRYFEGQLTPISELDADNAQETPQVRVTEAAEKVHWFPSPYFLLASDENNGSL